MALQELLVFGSCLALSNHPTFWSAATNAPQQSRNSHTPSKTQIGLSTTGLSTTKIHIFHVAILFLPTFGFRRERWGHRRDPVARTNQYFLVARRRKRHNDDPNQFPSEQTNGGFPTWGYPQIINFNRIFHYEPSILGYLKLWPPFNGWKNECFLCLQKKRSPIKGKGGINVSEWDQTEITMEIGTHTHTKQNKLNNDSNDT